MNLKQRFSLLFSTLFSIVITVVMLLVYTLFADFREEEFATRMSEKAINAARLLVEVNEIDEKMLKIIDKNTINVLYREKIRIFDDSLRLIYSSINDAPQKWTIEELKKIKPEMTLLRRDKDYDLYGMQYNSGGRQYNILISGQDKYGKRKLVYLKYLLIAASVIGSALVWMLSFYVSRKALQPFNTLSNHILDITEKTLNIRLPEKKKSDEINRLSSSFNQMMSRIDSSYNNQKAFTANASHELRTPVTRIVAQLENMIQKNVHDPETKAALERVSEDAYQLSDIISSLLLLSSINKNEFRNGFQRLRLDEVVFSATETITRLHPKFKMHFEIEADGDNVNMEILGDEKLLVIAIGNLFKNGFQYSSDGVVTCILKPGDKQIQLLVINKGDVPNVENTASLFNTFTRGTNTHNKSGSGLGLSIVQRILNYHNATVQYNIPDKNTNELLVCFYTNEPD